MRIHIAAAALLIMTASSAMSSTDPMTPLKEVTIGAGTYAATGSFLYNNRHYLGQGTVNAQGHVRLQSGPIFFWLQNGNDNDHPDHLTMMPMIDLQFDPVSGQSQYGLTIHSQYTPSLVHGFNEPSSPLMFESENSIFWSRQAGPIMLINVRTSVMVNPKVPGRVVGMEKGLVIFPSEPHGRAHAVPAFLNSRGRVEGIHSGRVFARERIFGAYEAGPGFIRLSFYPHYGQRLPDAQLEYIFRW